MSEFPLTVAPPVLFLWEKGDTGHVAWQVKGLYSSYNPERTSSSQRLGRKEIRMNDGAVRRNIVYRHLVAADQDFQRDVDKYGEPTNCVAVPGLNTGPMQMLARQLYRSGRGERAQQLSYVLDTVKIEDGSGRHIQTRSNCVTHALSLFCAGLSGVALSDGFLLLHPDMAMGPQANDFSRYFRSRKVYDGEEGRMFSGYYYVRSVYNLCMAFNLHHPGQYQSSIKYS